MNANITLSNGQRVTVSGIESLAHAERVAWILAVRFSAYYGKPLEVLLVEMSQNNFAAPSCFDSIMEGVTVLSSIGG